MSYSALNHRPAADFLSLFQTTHSYPSYAHDGGPLNVLYIYILAIEQTDFISLMYLSIV